MADRTCANGGTATRRDQGWTAKALRFWRQEGAVESLRRAAKGVAGIFFSVRAVRILACPCSPETQLFPTAVGAYSEEIGPDSLPDVDDIMYHPTRVLRQRLQDGERCFVAKVGVRPCNYEWVVLGTKAPRVAGLDLAPDQCYIYNGRTVRDMRGKRLHTFLLTAICLRLGQEGFRQAFARADSANRAALRAIERAGFHVVGSLRCWRVLGLSFERALPGSPCGGDQV